MFSDVETSYVFMLTELHWQNIAEFMPWETTGQYDFAGIRYIWPIKWISLIGCMVFKAVFNSISVVSRRQWTYPCFPGAILTSTPNNILSKPLAAFPHNHCLNNGQLWESNQSCRNDYHQSLERILAEPGIEQATFRSRVRNATDWAMGLAHKMGRIHVHGTLYTV